LVERRELTQWFFKISDMADDCLAPWMVWTIGPKKVADAGQLDRQIARVAIWL
jgi:leucyl-tRNA synthetase